MIASLEKMLQRDRAIVACGLVLVTLLAWAYLLYQAQRMSNMPMEGMEMNMSMGMEMAMPQMQSWQAIDLILIFTMWSVMMVGMMLPTAAPMILLFAVVSRKRREQERPFVSTGIFVLGYLMIEKIAPTKISPWLSRLAGVIFVGWGTWLIVMRLR